MTIGTINTFTVFIKQPEWGVMRLTKNQLAALAEHAEAPAETPEEYVKDVVGLLDSLRGERSYYSALVRAESMWFTIGPFTTTKQAHKAGKDFAGVVGGEHSITHHWTPEGLERHLAEVDAHPELDADWAVIRDDVELFRRGWDGKRATRKAYVQ